MRREGQQVCDRCGAVLSAWERARCACTGPRWGTNRELLYAIACSATEPLSIHDFVRNAERDFDAFLGPATAAATLTTDFRFCWAGKSVYGLYRHGALPGPRKLEEATRVILVAAGEPLDRDVVDFCLKQLGYRYNIASLVNAVAKSRHISSDWYGRWGHARGEGAELELRSQIPLVPPRRRSAWISLREETAMRIERAISDRGARLHALADPQRFGMNWEE